MFCIPGAISFEDIRVLFFLGGDLGDFTPGDLSANIVCRNGPMLGEKQKVSKLNHNPMSMENDNLLHSHYQRTI